MMIRKIFHIVSIVAVGCTASIAHAMTTEGQPVKGDAIRQIVSGKRIYLSVPLGGELPLHYRKDGLVDGSGEAVGLGKFLAPTDQGRWWVANDQLCQQWQSWYDGKIFCFKLETLPDDRLVWRRDDGEEGIARIGD